MKNAVPCRARGLFSSLSLGLFWVLAAQITLALALVLVLVLWPLTKQSAESKAGLMVLAVQTWQELPQGTRADFATELSARHGLELLPGCGDRPKLNAPWASYPAALQRALQGRLPGEAAPAVAVSADKRQVLACVWHNAQAFSLRFDAPHLLEGRLWALGLILLVSSLLAGLLALVLARRVARPLENMTRSVQTWGAQEPAPLPVAPSDVFEVCTLARTVESMHQRLHSHERAQTTLLAGISHDLRTPLARMRLALEMLPDEASLGLRAGLVRDVEAMERLIAQTLQFAQVHVDAIEDTELCAFAHTLAEDQRRGGIQLALTCAPSCHAYVAPLTLARILLNLIDNAWRYGGQSAVDVILHCTPQTWRFEVLDRGSGIPTHLLESVFQPFTRLEPSRNRATGGSGLGLSIVRQLAEAQGWQVGIDARPGGGSCAWVMGAKNPP